MRRKAYVHIEGENVRLKETSPLTKERKENSIQNEKEALRK